MLAQIFNIVPRLCITSFCKSNDDVNDNTDNTIAKFEGHLSIVAIKNMKKSNNKTFTFQNDKVADKVAAIIKKLNIKKSFKI